MVNMRIVGTWQIEVILQREEAKLVMNALDYVSHRIKKHGKKMLPEGSVDTLRSEIRVALGEDHIKI